MIDASSPYLVIIPARGGSKGIPRKNIKPLAGIPLIAHTIIAASDARNPLRVIVSTEDSEIAGVAKEWGAEILDRPFELALDETPTEPVMAHAYNQLTANGTYKPRIVLLLQCTSPLLRFETIDRCIELLVSEQYNSVLTASRTHSFFWRVRDDIAIPDYDYRLRPRRQDKGVLYEENGAVYAIKASLFERDGIRLGGRIGIVEMERLDSIEIDSPADLDLAEILIKQRT